MVVGYFVRIVGEKLEKWSDIINGYVHLVKSLGRHAKNIAVVFDGYMSSTKDHSHRRRQKLFCHDMKISLENTPYTTKEKFLSNGSNKSELIFYMSQALQNADVTTVCCRDDADRNCKACFKFLLWKGLLRSELRMLTY